MALERESIVRTALRLLDEVGLEALSLRRLARELDVHASALYWHFRDKQELLDEMARAIGGGPIPEEAWSRLAELSWDQWLAWSARHLRAAMRAHRDGALLLAAARPADYQLTFLERLFGALEAAGFSTADAARAFFAVTNYVLGTAIEEHQDSRREVNAELRAVADAHPALAGALAAVREADTTFEYGLELLLDGLRARLPAGRRTEEPGPRHPPAMPRPPARP